MQIDRKVLIIGYVWPEPTTTAAGGRMLQLVHFFLERDFQVTFASTATESEFSFDLETLGIDKISIHLNHSSFDGFISRLNPAIVLFDRFMTEEQFGWRVAQQVPDAIRILDTEDLHSLRSVRQIAHKKNTLFLEEDWLQADITKREIASIYRCDLSLIISLYEMKLLERVLGEGNKLLLHLPLMYPSIGETERESWRDYHNKEDFICIGNGKHLPNVAAVHRLKKEIWPLIHKEMPQCKLWIYGAYLPENIKRMHAPKEGFHIMGHVRDSGTAMSNARLNLAPLSFGAGIKGKLLEGMVVGTPSVTTPIGAEGICDDMPWNGIIADSSQEFADAAVALYGNRIQWETARENGAAILNSFYNKKVLKSLLYDKIGGLRSDLKKHRAQNFIGSLLLHHTLASTKYMSKWIEAKNSPGK
ncbi:MAG TPA: glycosyltransferase [Arenibacter sp.]|nr:glycosyltransferase [Arenibacter sp.]